MSTKFEPLKEGWLHPKLTARHMIEHASRKYLVFLISITTIATSIVNSAQTDIYPTLSVGLLLILLVVFSPVVGFISVGLGALFMWLLGKIVSGTATFKEMFRAMSVVGIPLFGALPFALAWMIFEPQSFFYSSDSLVKVTSIGTIAGIGSMVFSIWSFVNTVAAVAEAHRFSIGKALFTIFIQIIIVFLLIVGYLMLFLVSY